MIYLQVAHLSLCIENLYPSLLLFLDRNHRIHIICFCPFSRTSLNSDWNTSLISRVQKCQYCFKSVLERIRSSKTSTTIFFLLCWAPNTLGSKDPSFHIPVIVVHSSDCLGEQIPPAAHFPLRFCIIFWVKRSSQPSMAESSSGAQYFDPTGRKRLP